MQLRFSDRLPTQRSRIEVDDEELLDAFQLQPVQSTIVPLHLLRVSRDPQIPRHLHTLLRMQSEGGVEEEEGFHEQETNEV